MLWWNLCSSYRYCNVNCSTPNPPPHGVFGGVKLSLFGVQQFNCFPSAPSTNTPNPLILHLTIESGCHCLTGIVFFSSYLVAALSPAAISSSKAASSMYPSSWPSFSPCSSLISGLSKPESPTAPPPERHFSV